MEQELIKSVEQAEAVQDKMYKKAGEMIELMKVIRMDALKKRRIYGVMKRALIKGDREKVKACKFKLDEMKPLKIKF